MPLMLGNLAKAPVVGGASLTVTPMVTFAEINSTTSDAFGFSSAAAVGDWIIVIVAADNAGTNGAASISGVSIQSNGSATQRVLNNYDPGTASSGATLGIYTCPITTALPSGGTVTVTFSPTTANKAYLTYRVRPSAGATVTFVSAGNGTASNTISPSSGNISVSSTNKETIFGAAAIETDDLPDIDTDTSGGAWAGFMFTVADAGADASAMTAVAEYKTPNANITANWTPTMPTARDAAAGYLVIKPV